MSMSFAAERQTESAKKSDRRAIIRDAAARIFAARGYHGAAIQDVAAAIGVTKASLYYYYASKAEMLFDILTYADEEITAAIAHVERSEQAPLDRIRRVVEAHMAWYLQHPDIAKVAFRDWGELTGEALAEQVARRRRYGRLLRDDIAKCRDLGLIPADTNIVMVANFINGAVAAANLWFNAAGSDRPEEVARGFGDMAVATVLGAARAAASPFDQDQD